MPNLIYKKLDFLMKITGTKNAALGRALSYDASYISRVRNGKRGLPTQQPFIEPAAEYFASAIKDPIQKKMVAEQIGLRVTWPEDETAARKIIEAWLRSERPASNSIENIISAMNMYDTFPRHSGNVYIPAEGDAADSTLLYYGNSGKRDSSLTFLNRLAETGKSHQLLLYSDEDMSWLFEDDVFAMTWAAVMIKLIKKGSRITIIHTISRGTNEMYEAVSKWMPLYMTGAVEPWFYPGIRDGMFHRTMFIAEGHSALVSNSVTGQESQILNALISDKKAVASVESEFKAYLSKCKKLMDIVRTDMISDLSKIYRSFAEAPGEPVACLADDKAICIKQDCVAIVLKTEQPYAAFIIKEPRMLAALSEFLNNNPDCAKESRNALKKIEELLL